MKKLYYLCSRNFYNIFFNFPKKNILLYEKIILPLQSQNLINFMFISKNIIVLTNTSKIAYIYIEREKGYFGLSSAARFFDVRRFFYLGDRC